MVLELRVRFSTTDRFTVLFDDRETESLGFVSPLVQGDRDDVRWYLETYGASHTAEPDDRRAEAIAAKLRSWGQALFGAILGDRDAARMFNQFQDSDASGKLLTIGSDHPEILSLPWELLCDPAGTYLVHDNPRISVRRRYAGKGSGRRPFQVTQQQHLRVLMVVSRPTDAGFLDPRAEAQAMLAAAERTGEERLRVEFLRPATLDNLVQRLEDERLPKIDIVHFDGHGAFDPDGRLQERAKVHNEHLKAEATATNTGYLLFEDIKGESALVTAATLGDMLFRQKIGAMVLSACQSAAVAGEDALGCVAARLAYGGIPSVLAMQYSVLAVTAQRLFAAFYEQVLRGKGLGEALDNARRDLDRNRARGERQRGATQFTMHLQDWFLPALYQSGTDTPLLLPPLGEESGTKHSNNLRSNLPNPQATEADLPAGFWGRKWELWEIERAFVSGTRRLTIGGFGGQGKTTLAQEAGRWFQRTGMFETVCFVSYANYQGSDPLGYTVTVLGMVLAESFQTADEITGVLQQTRTLVILDNLESLEEPALALKTEKRSLLDAARQWSEAGQSRVLLTTRPLELQHADYPAQNSRQHIVLNLQGLLLQDAVDYCQGLFALPPASQYGLPHREGLEELLNMVDRHPLSIRLLTEQLKTRRPLDLRQALADLLSRENSTDPNRSLKASLNLSLQRLDPALQDWLPRLGVFQGGALENVLLTVVALSETDENLDMALARELFIANQKNDTEALRRYVGLMLNSEKLRNNFELPAGIGQVPIQNYQKIKNKLGEILGEISEKDLTEGIISVTWPQIRRELISSGLIQTEYLSGNDSPYIKFHPTLAPVLWERLEANTRKALIKRHQEPYYLLSQELNSEDKKNSTFARNLALMELPNLLFAVRNAIKNPSVDTPKFVNAVDYFLTILGMRKDRDDLTSQTTTLMGEVGSQSWYLIRSNEARQLIVSGCVNEAVPLFEEILKELGETPSHERSVTLGELGRCYRFLGQPKKAENFCRKGLMVAETLIETDPGNRRSHEQTREALLGDLANIFMDDGRYKEARKVCEEARAINLEFENESSAAVNNLRLGTLALQEGNLAESIERYLLSVAAFKKLNDPQKIAISYYQLGYAYAEVHEWEEAEKAYRTSAEIKASQGMIFGDSGAAATWNQLGLVCRSQGKLDAAENWHCKALEIFQQSNGHLEK